MLMLRAFEAETLGASSIAQAARRGDVQMPRVPLVTETAGVLSRTNLVRFIDAWLRQDSRRRYVAGVLAECVVHAGRDRRPFVAAGNIVERESWRKVQPP